MSTACFVLLIGVFFFAWKYKKKSQSLKIVLLSTTDHNTNDNKDIDLNLENHNTVNSFESAYDEIDESCFVNSLTTLRKTKQSVNTATLDELALLAHRNIKEQNSLSPEYLTPISGTDKNDDHSDIKDISVILAVETPECLERQHSAVSDYLIPVNPYQDSYVNDPYSDGDDYLHPYTYVISDMKRYSIPADIHTENQISSESDEEANDHKYSHLYEQLGHDWKDNCSTYTYPLSSKHSITQSTAENVCIQNSKESNTFQKDDTENDDGSGFCEMKTSSQSSSGSPRTTH